MLAALYLPTALYLRTALYLPTALYLATALYLRRRRCTCDCGTLARRHGPAVIGGPCETGPGGRDAGDEDNGGCGDAGQGRFPAAAGGCRQGGGGRRGLQGIQPDR